MIYDMVYYKEHFPDKFLELLEHRYSKIDKTKRRKQFLDKYSEKFFNGVEFQINQWCSLGQKDRVPTLEQLTNICNLLDCDMDYFLTDQKEFKKETRHAAETTGLLYDTVDIISNFSLEQKQILNLLTLSDKPTNLGELLKDFYDYTQSSLQHGTIIDDAVEDAEKKERSIHVDELLTIRRFDISNKMNNMLESLRALYWNKILKQGVEIQKKKDKIRMEDFAKTLKRMGATDKETEKRVSEVSASSGHDEIYNNLKI